MNNRINRNKLQINKDFYSFINKNVLKNLNIEENYFWEGFSKIIYELTPINEDLIKKRQYIQNQLLGHLSSIYHGFQNKCIPHLLSFLVLIY